MLNIQKLLINYNFSNRNESIKFIVIHDVGETGSTAQNNRDYFSGGNRGASADFFVDSNNIIQIIDYINNYSWAIGDGHGAFGKTNGNSVSIEMCLESNGQPSEKTIQNTLELTNYLMKQLDIGISNVVRHYDCSHKCCPESFSDNNWAKWNQFKARLSTPTPTIKFRKVLKVIKSNALCINPITGALVKKFKVGDLLTAIDSDSVWWVLTIGEISKANCVEVITPIKSTTITSTPTLGTVTATTLNVRESPNVNSKIIGQLTKGEKVKIDCKRGNWYSTFYGDHGGYVSADYIK
ncbi:N-acetylmuramoyl-L-alanine amidase [Clostridium estertheticum]|uniref:N-acetylmuramoyl-L-alanine amidase n=1 Tax=Clostridium estertheticum subsp. estertheticum TaxID=1552 RepID=A0A1J0GIA6_9CLOT|nr:N-acetylmuramoyl-L-alanine amidase [Clostridium estertheticum]APC41043.1 hypothetical protein A7L45_13640 [Clostridium estertheticum subsp. estertheticum]